MSGSYNTYLDRLTTGPARPVPGTGDAAHLHVLAALIAAYAGRAGPPVPRAAVERQCAGPSPPLPAFEPGRAWPDTRGSWRGRTPAGGHAYALAAVAEDMLGRRRRAAVVLRVDGPVGDGVWHFIHRTPRSRRRIVVRADATGLAAEHGQRRWVLAGDPRAINLALDDRRIDDLRAWLDAGTPPYHPVLLAAVVGAFHDQPPPRLQVVRPDRRTVVALLGDGAFRRVYVDAADRPVLAARLERRIRIAGRRRSPLLVFDALVLRLLLDAAAAEGGRMQLPYWPHLLNEAPATGITVLGAGRSSSRSLVVPAEVDSRTIPPDVCDVDHLFAAVDSLWATAVAVRRMVFGFVTADGRDLGECRLLFTSRPHPVALVCMDSRLVRALEAAEEVWGRTEGRTIVLAGDGWAARLADGSAILHAGRRATGAALARLIDLGVRRLRVPPALVAPARALGLGTLSMDDPSEPPADSVAALAALLPPSWRRGGVASVAAADGGRLLAFY